jgi:inosine-uridine nucleoside N-ribohydrolase
MVPGMVSHRIDEGVAIDTREPGGVSNGSNKRSLSLIGTALVMGLALTACDAGAVSAPVTTAPAGTTSTGAVEEEGPTPVIVDYSPTVSDVGGLLYLLAHPGVEVIAVSLPVTGEAGCDLGVEVTLGILAMFGRDDVPVACDPEVPAGAKPWPAEFLAGQRNLRFGLPAPVATPSDLSGPDLIAAAAAGAGRPVVLYAVGPLTNVARALDRHPDLAGYLDRIVIMGGAVDAPGNVEGTNAEWNLWIDVQSAAEVIASGVPVTLVPLDATEDVPVPGWYERVLADANQSDAIVYLHRMVRTFPGVTSGFFYLWDELAASVAAGEDHVTTEEMRISVVVGGPDDGRTVHDDGANRVTVAVATPGAKAFYADFLGTLAGAPVEAGREATAAEAAYLRDVGAALSGLELVFEAAFSDPAFEAALSEGDYDGAAVSAALDRLLAGVTASYQAAAEVSPPPSLQELHDNLLDVFGLLVERRAEIVTAAAGAETWQAFEEVVSDVPDIAEGCSPIAEEAEFLGIEIELVC